MRGNPSSGLGLLHATVLAALSTLLTSMGHVAGGGSIPDLAILVVLCPLLAGMLVAPARRRTSAAGTVVTLAAGQFALHHLLVLLHPSHHGTGQAVLGGTGMLAMHTVATLAIAVLVRRADQALTVLAAVLRRVVPRRLAVPPADPPMPTLPTLPVPGPAVAARLARSLAAATLRRGPPLRCWTPSPSPHPNPAPRAGAGLPETSCPKNPAGPRCPPVPLALSRCSAPRPSPCCAAFSYCSGRVQRSPTPAC